MKKYKNIMNICRPTVNTDGEEGYTMYQLYGGLMIELTEQMPTINQAFNVMNNVYYDPRYA